MINHQRVEPTKAGSLIQAQTLLGSQLWRRQRKVHVNPSLAVARLRQGWRVVVDAHPSFCGRLGVYVFQGCLDGIVKALIWNLE